MTGSGLTLTRRRLLGGLGTVAAASAATGAGTMAYFTDTESSTGNTVQAGTLDLKPDDGSEITFLDAAGVAPGDSGEQSIELANDGSIAGSLEIEILEVRDSENGFSGNENSVDDTDDQGELQEYLEIQVFVDGDPRTDWYYVSQLSAGRTLPLNEAVGPGGTRTVTVEWRFEDPGDKSVNEAQGDSLAIDALFRLRQTGGG